MEAKYLEGEMTATRFLDEASHFFDGWSVHTLDDDWNEAYGAYIQQIEDHRNEATTSRSTCPWCCRYPSRFQCVRNLFARA